MNQNEILESNKLIAEFMGEIWVSTVGDKFYIESRGRNNMIGLEVKYHSSWDWLMPVVEKIESLTVKGIQWTALDDNSPVDWNFEIVFKSKQCTINRCAYDGDEEDFLELYDCRYYENGISKIEVVFKAVIEFIKWYNHEH